MNAEQRISPRTRASAWQARSIQFEILSSNSKDVQGGSVRCELNPGSRDQAHTPALNSPVRFTSIQQTFVKTRGTNQ